MIRTRRLTLRPFTLADQQFLFAMDNDKVVNKYRSRDTVTMDYCQHQIANWTAWYDVDDLFNVYLMELSDSKTPIGLVFLVKRPDHQYEIGYRLQEQYWRNGYTQEGVEALIDRFYQEGYCQEIYAVTHQNNLGSKGLLKTLGFQVIRDDGDDGIHFKLKKTNFY